MSSAEKAAEAMAHLQKYAPEEYEKHLVFTQKLGESGSLQPVTLELILVGLAASAALTRR